MAMVVGSRDMELRTRDRKESVWRKFLDAVVKPQPGDAAHEIIEYLQRHRYDWPPEVRIELERRRLGP